MNIQQLLDIVLKDTYTKADSLKRFRLLKDFVDFWLFSNSTVKDIKVVKDAFLKKAVTQVSPANITWFSQLDDAFLTTFYGDGTNKSSLAATNMLKQMEDGLAKAPIVTIKIPFEHDATVINQIGAWIKQNLGHQYMIELVFDGNLIGGCAFSLNGVYRDYSLRSLLDQNKAAVTQMLTSYKK